MHTVHEELLMAYADGELQGSHIVAVECLLRCDSEARRTVAMFRMTADLARHAYSEAIWLDPPPHVLRLIDGRARTSGWSALRQTCARTLLGVVWPRRYSKRTAANSRA